MQEKDNRVNINFGHSEDTENHKCESYRSGDWIIFHCAICEDYERHLNWRTGEMKLIKDGSSISHIGNYFPIEYKDAFENIN